MRKQWHQRRWSSNKRDGFSNLSHIILCTECSALLYVGTKCRSLSNHHRSSSIRSIDVVYEYIEPYLDAIPHSNLSANISQHVSPVVRLMACRPAMVKLQRSVNDLLIAASCSSYEAVPVSELPFSSSSSVVSGPSEDSFESLSCRCRRLGVCLGFLPCLVRSLRMDVISSERKWLVRAFEYRTARSRRETRES